MVNSDETQGNLIAPCGMNCAICSNYLAFKNNLNKSQCSGCRPSDKNCSYLFGKCEGINHQIQGNAKAKFCFDCEKYPCKEIERMDRRYTENYGMSVKDNLEQIKKVGPEEFAIQQNQKYGCKTCAGLVSIHNKKCFSCESIVKLVEK